MIIPNTAYPKLFDINYTQNSVILNDYYKHFEYLINQYVVEYGKELAEILNRKSSINGQIKDLKIKHDQLLKDIERLNSLLEILNEANDKRLQDINDKINNLSFHSDDDTNFDGDSFLKLIESYNNTKQEIESQNQEQDSVMQEALLQVRDLEDKINVLLRTQSSLMEDYDSLRQINLSIKEQLQLISSFHQLSKTEYYIKHLELFEENPQYVKITYNIYELDMSNSNRPEYSLKINGNDLFCFVFVGDLCELFSTLHSRINHDTYEDIPRITKEQVSSLIPTDTSTATTLDNYRDILINRMLTNRIIQLPYIVAYRYSIKTKDTTHKPTKSISINTALISQYLFDEDFKDFIHNFLYEVCDVGNNLSKDDSPTILIESVRKMIDNYLITKLHIPI